MKEYGITANSVYVKNGDLYMLKPEVGETVVKEMAGKGGTAVCAVNDYVATFLMSCMRRLGIAVPDQMFVIGFDDLSISKILDTPMTTVHQDLYQIGKCTGEIVLEAVQSGRCSDVRKVIPVRLIVRDTCRELRR